MKVDGSMNVLHVSILLTCRFVSLPRIKANVNTDTGLGCAEVTRGICTQLDDACCPPCSGVASKYLNCVVSTAFADDCPGASCDMVEGAPSPDTNITTTTTITGNTITTTTTTTTNTSSTTIVSNTTGSITSNSTMMEEDSEIEERVASSVVIDVEDKESDADNAYNSEKPVAASEKVPVKLNEETPDAAAIRTSNAYRSNHRHDVSSVAMFGVLLIALEFVRTM